MDTRSKEHSTTRHDKRYGYTKDDAEDDESGFPDLFHLKFQRDGWNQWDSDELERRPKEALLIVNQEREWGIKVCHWLQGVLCVIIWLVCV